MNKICKVWIFIREKIEEAMCKFLFFFFHTRLFALFILFVIVLFPSVPCVIKSGGIRAFKIKKCEFRIQAIFVQNTHTYTREDLSRRYSLLYSILISLIEDSFFMLHRSGRNRAQSFALWASARAPSRD